MPTAHRAVDQVPTRIRHRKSVEKLDAAQSKMLRDAIGGMAPIKDERGFQYMASLHGGPPTAYCKHGTTDGLGRYHGAPLFLPWHRAYLHFFELEMQDRVPEATLAWWDWSSPQSHTEGIPAVYAASRVGGSANPLASQPIRPGPGRPSGLPARSWRDAGDPGQLPSPQAVERILSLSQFLDFSTQLEQQLHNMVHGWVGGAMGQVPIAAYDPVFYAHHTMVDRLWNLWQLRHGQAGPPHDSFGIALEPFPMTVADVLDVTKLGYEYAGSTVHAPGTR